MGKRRKIALTNMHVLLDLHGCTEKELEKVAPVKKMLNAVAKKAKLNVLGNAWHQFKPYGVTGVLLLSQSHITIHTWPEYGLAMVDIFSCDQKKAKAAVSELIKRFNPKRVVKKNVLR